MDKIWYFIISIFVIISLGFLTVIFLVISNAGLSPKAGELEECNVLKYSGEDAISMVFFGSRPDSEKYMKYLLGFGPLVDFNDRFNFYYIDSSQYSPDCEIYKGVAILCYNRDLIKKAASCPNDQIVVLENEGSQIRSSAYMNVMSINLNHPISVLAHEFGHTFVNLAEEYVPARLPRGAKNCVSECSEFDGKEDGCFEGCSLALYKRSIENGVMRTLRADKYGSFNDGLVIEKINDFPGGGGLVGRAVDEPRNCENEKYYLIEGILEEEGIEFLKRSVEKGCIGDSGSGGFFYNMILQDDSKLEGNEFNPELIFTDGPDMNGDGMIDGEVFDAEKEFFLKVPVVEDAESLEIKDVENEFDKSVDLYDIGGRLCLVG